MIIYIFPGVKHYEPA